METRPQNDIMQVSLFDILRRPVSINPHGLLEVMYLLFTYVMARIHHGRVERLET